MIIDANMYWFDESIFHDKHEAERFLLEVPKSYGINGYMIENKDHIKQIVIEKPIGYQNMNYVEDVNREVNIEIIYFGYIAIIAVQPELSSVTAMDIRKQSHFPLTMVNGGMKYMPDQISYDCMTYEAMNSKL